MTNTNRLYRSSKDSMIFGVAGGMAEYFDIDPSLMRVAWVLFILATGGTALLVYIILALIVPRDTSVNTEPSGVMRENLESLPAEAAGAGRHIRDEFTGAADVGNGAGKARRRNLLAFALIFIGLLVLFGNLGLLWWWRWAVLWPLIIIVIGIAILVSRARRS